MLRPFYIAEHRREGGDNMDGEFLRGEIFYADLEPVVGSEQGGERPVIILQNNKGNQYSNTVVVAPMTTSQIKPPLPTHVVLETEGLRCTSTVLLEQIRTIDKQRMSEHVGTVSDTDMKRIEKAILAELGMDYSRSRSKKEKDGN